MCQTYLREWEFSGFQSGLEVQTGILSLIGAIQNTFYIPVAKCHVTVVDDSLLPVFPVLIISLYTPNVLQQNINILAMISN